MSNPMNYPIPFLLISLFAFLLAGWFGTRLHAKHGAFRDEVRDFFAIILGAALALLSLIIAFTFSMAVSRYDQRKNYEEQEANAIGTEYLRADQFSPADAARIHALLRRYLDQRVAFYKTRDERELLQINLRTAQLQSELWSAASSSAAALPAPMAAFVLAGMNDVLNSQGYTQAAWWNRIPVAAWILLIVISVFCNLLVGFGSPGKSAFIVLILPIVLSVSLYLMADIDSPRHGIINVKPQNLESLAQSLQPQ